jgi:hypothetical protein
MPDNGVSTDGRKRVVDDSRADRNTMFLALYTNAVPWNPTNTVVMYTEPTYTGYARIPITSWGPAFVNGLSQAESDAATYSFNGTAGGVVTIQGYFVVDGGGLLFGAVSNEVPGGVPFYVPGGSYNVTPKFIAGDLC